MWTVLEAAEVKKELRRCPQRIRDKYEQWKVIVRTGGPRSLAALPGLHDEPLAGQWRGFRSSRLSLQWRVIYQVQGERVTVVVVRISAHDYGRGI
jgi:addiction module RelE/StbE family toxin